MAIDAEKVLALVVSEIGVPTVIGLIRRGLEASPNTHVSERVKRILGDKLQSEIEYELAVKALREADSK